MRTQWGKIRTTEKSPLDKKEKPRIMEKIPLDQRENMNNGEKPS